MCGYRHAHILPPAQSLEGNWREELLSVLSEVGLDMSA
jgi:hypothetical protein